MGLPSVGRAQGVTGNQVLTLQLLKPDREQTVRGKNTAILYFPIESTESRNWALLGLFFFLSSSICPNPKLYLVLTDQLLHVSGICALNVDLVNINALCCDPKSSSYQKAFWGSEQGLAQSAVPR